MASQIKFKKRRLVMLGTGTPETMKVPITPGSVMTHQFEMYPAAGNAAVVYKGDEDVDTTNIPRAAGSYIVYTSSERGDTTAGGDYFDLSKIFFLGNLGDVVIIEYLAIQNAP